MIYGTFLNWGILESLEGMVWEDGLPGRVMKLLIVLRAGIFTRASDCCIWGLWGF